MEPSWPTAGSATDAGPTRVAIAVGSNLGDRASHIAFAVHRLKAVVGSLRVSHLIDTDPVGVGAQPVFLNGAIVGVTGLAAHDLLEYLLAVERERGRERPFAGAPRTLDLDLVLYGDLVVAGPGLTLPHPRFRDRAFVLQPLVEIASDMRDPVTGLTVGELLARLQGRH